MCSVGGCDRSASIRGWCSAHYARWRKHGDVLAGTPLTAKRSDLGKPHGPQDPRLLDPERRPCRDCKQVKPLSEFGPMGKGPLGKRYACRPCDALKAQRERARWDTDPQLRQRRLETQRRSYVKQAYGADGLLADERISRGEPCDVCGQHPEGKRAMAIDHCHVTGRVRGILCKDCNLVLGWMKDDPARLRALADYVEHARTSASPVSSDTRGS
jgi:hypothetical protein